MFIVQENTSSTHSLEQGAGGDISDEGDKATIDPRGNLSGVRASAANNIIGHSPIITNKKIIGGGAIGNKPQQLSNLLKS